MAVQRGATSQVTAIAEVTPNTTPATPVMIQLPVNSWTPKLTPTVIKSNQIRAHPYVDQMMRGRVVYDLALEYEMQGPNHDLLLQTFFGSTISTKTMAFADALKTLSMEETVASGTYNQFTGCCFNQLSVSCAASDTAPVKVSMTGMSLGLTADAASTIASSVTPATSTSSWIFPGATLQLGGATPVASGQFTINRQIDPLMILGSRNPREWVVGAVTSTGSITVPYDTTGGALGTTISADVTGFTDVALTYKFTDEAAAVYRQIVFPKTKFVSLGRDLNSRGARMQVINYEAYYDTSSTTLCTLSTQ